MKDIRYGNSRPDGFETEHHTRQPLYVYLRFHSRQAWDIRTKHTSANDGFPGVRRRRNSSFIVAALTLGRNLRCMEWFAVGNRDSPRYLTWRSNSTQHRKTDQPEPSFISRWITATISIICQEVVHWTMGAENYLSNYSTCNMSTTTFHTLSFNKHVGVYIVYHHGTIWGWVKREKVQHGAVNHRGSIIQDLPCPIRVVSPLPLSRLTNTNKMPNQSNKR